MKNRRLAVHKGTPQKRNCLVLIRLQETPRRSSLRKFRFGIVSPALIRPEIFSSSIFPVFISDLPPIWNQKRSVYPCGTDIPQN
jgi:hypothetical protein